jgi:hypothetical protein
MLTRSCWILAWGLLSGVMTAGQTYASTPLAQFCSEAQKIIVNTSLVAQNDRYENFEAFTKSKPSVTPLVTTQYVWPQRLPQGEIMQISCKMKTADHLQSIHGTQAAGVDVGCRGVNQHTLAEVLRTMTDEERSNLKWKPEQTLIFAEDIVTTSGPFWLEPYPMVREEAGNLVIQAKGMQNDWNDPRYLAAPPQFRGTRYCHLITPEYLRALLLGQPINAW